MKWVIYQSGCESGNAIEQITQINHIVSIVCRWWECYDINDKHLDNWMRVSRYERVHNEHNPCVCVCVQIRYVVRYVPRIDAMNMTQYIWMTQSICHSNQLAGKVFFTRKSQAKIRFRFAYRITAHCFPLALFGTYLYMIEGVVGIPANYGINNEYWQYSMEF